MGACRPRASASLRPAVPHGEFRLPWWITPTARDKGFAGYHHSMPRPRIHHVRQNLGTRQHLRNKMINAELTGPLRSLCNICTIRPAGSKEHLPGMAASNSGPIEVIYLGSSRNASGEVEHVSRLEKDGFVVRTICSHCNNRTGGDYGTAYKSFVEQFTNSGVVEQAIGRSWISVRDIQPLRVIKQMMCMFLAAQPNINPHWKGIRKLVLNKDRRMTSERLRVYLYRNTSQLGRVIPFTGMASVRKHWPPILLSEISWPPVGIVFTTESHPLTDGMYEITDWARAYRFRSRDTRSNASFTFDVPQLATGTHWPLGFGTESQVFEWAERAGVMMMLLAVDGEGEGGVPIVTGRAPTT
jgi:hypothetical protein